MFKLSKIRQQKDQHNKQFFETFNSPGMNKVALPKELLANNFDTQSKITDKIYRSLKSVGLEDFTLIRFNFHFLSETIETLEKLNAFLLYNYKHKLEGISTWGESYLLRGKTSPVPLTKEVITFWALDMKANGDLFNCRFNYVLPYTNTGKKDYPDFNKAKINEYSIKAFESYSSENFSDAIIFWTIILEINPRDPDTYFWRANAKSWLNACKSAINDYNKALEIRPDFAEALVNRGSIKEENGDFDGATNDYTAAIKLKPNDFISFCDDNLIPHETVNEIKKKTERVTEAAIAG